MGFIERTYQSTITFINAAGQSQYAALASDLGFATRTISIILIILVLINMGTQTRATEASVSIGLVIKLTLVALFMQNWTQFNAVFLAFDQMFDLLGQRLLAVSLGDSDTSSFPQALDNLSFKTSEYATVTSGRLNIAGAFMSFGMAVLIAILGALATLALIISKVVLAVLVAIAPLAIVASLTPATKSFFEAWLSAVIMMFMYPLVLGGA
jgi:type IV secretion system protein VirB6